MYSRFRFSLLLAMVVIGGGRWTMAQLTPELASSPVSPCPINIDTKKTIHVKTDTPLTLYTPLTEYVKVNNTGKAIDIIRMKLHPIGIIGTTRGGVLGHDVYEYFRFQFFFNTNLTKGQYSFSTVDGVGEPLEALVYCFNRKYGTQEKALGKPDGLIQISFRVIIKDTAPNLLYSHFEHTMNKVQHPDNHVCSLGGFAYYWYVRFPCFSTYYAYRGTYIDDAGKAFPATTIVLPLEPQNYISLDQFLASFGSLKNGEGKPLTANVQRQCHRGKTIITESVGLIVKNLIG